MAKSLVTDYLPLRAHQVLSELGWERAWECVWRWTVTRGLREWQSSIGIRVFPRMGVQLRYQHGGELVEPYVVPVVTTVPNYGGVRFWWLCPSCGRRCSILYGGRLFLCRLCHNLTYRTAQSGTLRESLSTRMAKIRRKLGAETVRPCDPLPDKPRYMHYSTYFRLFFEYYNLVRLWFLDFERGLAFFPEMRGPAQQATADLDVALRQYREDPGHLPETWLRRECLLDEDVEDLDSRRTLGQTAEVAEVSYAFAKEAEREGLIQPDAGRGKRRKRYRPKVASWLKKLHVLRESGESWDEIRAWTHRRFQPGHEHEVRWPQGYSGG